MIWVNLLVPSGRNFNVVLLVTVQVLLFFSWYDLRLGWWQFAITLSDAAPGGVGCGALHCLAAVLIYLSFSTAREHLFRWKQIPQA
mgnify:CR=1 FL=1